MLIKPKHLSARILLEDKIIIGAYLEDNQTFEFCEPFYQLDNRLKVREFLDDRVIITFIFSSDYMPRKFTLKKDEPLILDDYIEIEDISKHYQIVIEMKS